ncbi:MAG: tetraacyldisaccharide 4'-kinase [Desulfuromonadaceae bacterium]|nr:tetraacyldisaccharide 4'-kinase [Desulfuromonadaceae bacterium]
MREQIALFYRRLALDGCRFWYDYLLMLVLIPCGYVYGFIGQFRVWLYQRGFLSTSRAHVPVICVGNLVVGGTGKTPVVSWILDCLRQRGYRTAVISRGYASSAGADPPVKARQVKIEGAHDRAHAAATYGDEPVLLALRHPETIVVVAPRRVDGVRYIQRHHEVDVIILDDAFQHLALERDLDLVLLDARKPLGNGHVLPAGLMRERRSALQRADMLLMTRYHPGVVIPEMNLKHGEPKETVHVSSRLAHYALDLSGARIPLSDLSHLRLGAFAGIADPDDFFASLHRYAIQPFTTVPLVDHVSYTAKKVHYIHTRCEGVDAFITTEKDAVKLDPKLFTLPCYYVPLEIEPVELEKLEQALLGVLTLPKTR